MGYEVEFTSKAAKQLLRLPKNEQRRVNSKIAELETDPRPSGCVKLTGFKNSYRVRSGDYRIVYSVDDEIRIVSVSQVGHRREVYR